VPVYNRLVLFIIGQFYLKTRSLLCVVFYFFSHTLAAVQDDDFWLLLTPPAESSFSINTFTNNQQQLLFGLQLDQKINSQLHINLAWSQYDIKANIRSASVGFSGDPYNNWLWFYNIKQWGEASLIQSRDHEFRLQYYTGKWYALIGLQRGDLEINFVRTLRNGQSAASSDHRALISGLGYSQTNFYWQFEYIQHQYQKDLSQLASNRFLISLIEPTALQQSSTLNDSSSQFTIGFNHDVYTISTQLYRLKSALTQSNSDFLGLSLNLAIGINQQIGLHINSPLQTGSSSIGVSFSQQW